jgi:predicted O-methyltransferase YrrM
MVRIIPPLTDALFPVRNSNLALPRAEKIDWYISTAVYELFGEKDVLDIGCFTGANTLYLASIAKSKNRMVYSIDNWTTARKHGISPDRAKGLFYAHLDLLDTREHCQLLEKHYMDITDEEIDRADYIFHDVNTATTDEVLSLFNKIKSKTILIIDDWNKKGRDFDIDVLLKLPTMKEFLRTKNRFYGAVKFTKKEFDNIKNGVEKI